MGCRWGWGQGVGRGSRYSRRPAPQSGRRPSLPHRGLSPHCKLLARDGVEDGRVCAGDGNRKRARRDEVGGNALPTAQCGSQAGGFEEDEARAGAARVLKGGAGQIGDAHRRWETRRRDQSEPDAIGEMPEAAADAAADIVKLDFRARNTSRVGKPADVAPLVNRVGSLKEQVI